MKLKLLKLLHKNSRLSLEEMAVMLGVDSKEIASAIDEMEKEGIIRGYKAVIDWERVDNTYVSALIELKVTPKATLGFEEVAENITKSPEVESVYLMSGGYDFTVILNGKTLREVSQFVSDKLSTLDSVLSTSTHFVLKKYKEHGTVLAQKSKDERMLMTL